VKRVDLIKRLEALGCELVRHGGKHDWYRNLETGVIQAVPRHREIKEPLARHILRLMGAQSFRSKTTSDDDL
jgi:predicted RNA binding protein YcfA (HicA-like mRNA interferase family)